MENSTQYNQRISQQEIGMNEKRMLPHSIAVLITGILAIQCSFLYGMGLAFGVVALILGRKSGKYLNENPGIYSEGSAKMYRAGKTCGIIGLILSALIIIGVVVFLAYYLPYLRDAGHNHHFPPPPPPPQPHR